MPNRPNILWYCTDQQRFDTIEGLNNPHIHTPHITKFMQEATTFTHACCQAPICTPSRASFLTGQYPSAVGVLGNGNAHFPRSQETRLITRVLADSGYDVGNVGKLHLAGAALGREKRVNDGYRYFQYSHSRKGPNAFGHDYAEWLRIQGADPNLMMAEENPETYLDGAALQNFGGLFEPTPDQDNVPPQLHQTFWCTQKTIEFMDKNRGEDQPWFATVNPFDPHPPFDAPWEYYRRYDPQKLPGAHFQPTDLEHQQKLADAGVDFQSRPRHPNQWNHKKVQASYYAMVEQIDHEFGRLLDHLDATGQRSNTIVIFTSDHGETLCDHGMILKGCRFFEGLIRVPLIISWPGHFKPATVSDALVELVDISATIYGALGMKTPFYSQGKSLMPILTGQSDGRDHRHFVRAEYFGAMDYPDQTHATMYRERKWKLNTYHGKNLFELYDLENDPWEFNNLSENGQYRQVLFDLICKSFDAQVYAHQAPPPRRMPF